MVIYYDYIKTIEPCECRPIEDDTKTKRMNEVTGQKYCTIETQCVFDKKYRAETVRITDVYYIDNLAERTRLADVLQKNADSLKYYASEYRK